MTSKPELLPCPFCGSPAATAEWMKDYDAVHCSNTLCEINGYAIRLNEWNHRNDATLRTAEERGYARGVEEACRAVCKLCAEGRLEAGRCRGHWHHYWSTEGDEGGEIAGDCEAWKIRNLLPGRKERDEPTAEYVRGYLDAANEIAEPYPPDIPMFAPLSDEEIQTAVAAMGGDISGRLHAHWARHWADVLRERMEEKNGPVR